MKLENSNIADNDIVELYWQRSEKAIDYTYQKYGMLCLSISESILNNRFDAEECLDDMYIAVWNTIPPHKPESLKFYVCKLIRRISINKVKFNNAEKRGKMKTVSFEEIEEELGHEFADESVTDDDSRLSEIINEYLASLPQKRRTVLILRYWHSMSLMDISKKMGMNINTVKSILSRELQNMKKYFIREGVYHE